jgi:FkbM family methyltransferase
MSFLHSLKRLVESIFGLHIYRSTMPHGVDLIYDIRRMGLWPERPLIFDVGAHVGQTALSLLEDLPAAEIHCFEPASSNYQKLQKAVADHGSVHAWQMAFADEPGQLQLHLKPHSTTHSLVNKGGATETELVQVETLDAFCERNRIGKVHYCKIDTEGADLVVLQGAKTLLQRRAIDFVQVETSTRKDVDVFSPFHHVDDYLISMGYELFGFYEQQPCWTGRQSLLYFNAVYISPALLTDRLPIE